MEPDIDDDRREKENDSQEACLNPGSSITDPKEQVDFGSLGWIPANPTLSVVTKKYHRFTCTYIIIRHSIYVFTRMYCN